MQTASVPERSIDQRSCLKEYDILLNNTQPIGYRLSKIFAAFSFMR
jgi:hypothetical protein